MGLDETVARMMAQAADRRAPKGSFVPTSPAAATPERDFRPGILNTYSDFPVYIGDAMRVSYNPLVTGIGFIRDEEKRVVGLTIVESLYNESKRKGAVPTVTEENRRQAYLAISDYVLDRVTAGSPQGMEYNNNYRDGVGHIDLLGAPRAVLELVIDALNTVDAAMFDGAFHVDLSALKGEPWGWGHSLTGVLGFADYIIKKQETLALAAPATLAPRRTDEALLARAGAGRVPTSEA